MPSPRQRFLNYMHDPYGSRPVVSPFLPHQPVIQNTMTHLGLPVTGDFIADEICLAEELDYEPMFMTDFPGLMFPWKFDPDRSDSQTDVYTIPTSGGEWLRRVPRLEGLATDERSAMETSDSSYPVQTEADHAMLVQVCEQVNERETATRAYFRGLHERVGEGGVIVIGHPHPSWLGYQISQTRMYYHWSDYPETYRRSMDAIYTAALFIMQIALAEGIDFMSDSSYGLEMTSPQLFKLLDMPYIQRFSDWTHERQGLMWYHNCGQTRKLIAQGLFNRLGVDLIETIPPPPAGDNDLAEARRQIAPQICTKGNLDLSVLRLGTPDEVRLATRRMVTATRGYKHIFSTADAVLTGTPPENFITFVRTVRELT